MDDPQPAYRLRFTPVGNSLNEHQGVIRGATLPHNPMTPFQMELQDCGPTAAGGGGWSVGERGGGERGERGSVPCRFRGGTDGDGHLFWDCTFPPLVHHRESPEFAPLVAADKSHWPRFMLWHGWLAGWHRRRSCCALNKNGLPCVEPGT